MNTTRPKLLPWLAHKAGISLQRADTLWQAAQRHAAVATRQISTPAYWQAAMTRLLELLAAERQREDIASFGWRNWTRWHTRQWQQALTALDALAVGVEHSLRAFRLPLPG